MIRRTIDAAFKDIDLVVVPTTTSLPKKINDSLARETSDRTPKRAYDFFDPTSGCNNTAPFDVYGIPALSLPCGFSKDSLPVGLMIAGPYFSEGKVLALAYAFRQATDWHKCRPDITPDTPVAPLIEASTDVAHLRAAHLRHRLRRERYGHRPHFPRHRCHPRLPVPISPAP